MSEIGKVQLVIPMAGLGTRFSSAGYKTPKPFLPIHGRTMIEVVLENLDSKLVGLIVLICRRDAPESASLRTRLERFAPRLTILFVDETTDGPAGTVELAYAALNLDLPVVVANSDQYLDANLDEFYKSLEVGAVSGSLICMRDSDPKWSFAEPGPDQTVLRVAEKDPISDLATTGVYGFSSARVMFDAFKAMREVNDRTNNEFYVGPSYNYVPGKVTYVDLGPVSKAFYGLGVPEDYESFLVKVADINHG